MPTYVERCMERAKVADSHADNARDPEARRVWHSVANSWREIATDVSQRITHGITPESGT